MAPPKSGYTTSSYFITVNTNKNTSVGSNAILAIRERLRELIPVAYGIYEPNTKQVYGTANRAQIYKVMYSSSIEIARDGRYHLHALVRAAVIYPWKVQLKFDMIRDELNRTFHQYAPETDMLHINFKLFYDNALALQLYQEKQQDYQTSEYTY